ncbi:MAG: hybrid sensor histidine kinase/response regulator [Chloroherpetonaceae bacterium]
MTGSGILLGNPKAKKKSSKSASRTSLTPEVQANTTLKLFIEDVSGRLKSHLKKRKGKHSKLFISFFSQLSAEPAPIEALSSLQLEVFSDFLGFLENVKSKLVSSNSANASDTYQLLTENLDSTADFLSQLLVTVENNESVLNALRQYLSVDSSPTPSSKSHKATPSQSPASPVAEKPKSNGSSNVGSRVFRKGKRVIHYYKDVVNADFGFDLSLLASLSPTSIVTSKTPQPVKKSATVKAPPAARIAPALQNYFNTIASFSREIVAEKSYPSTIADAMEKLAASADVFSDLVLFASLPGVIDFIEFSKTLNEESINALGEAVIRDIAGHLCDSFTSDVAQSLIATYLATPSATDVDSVFESLTPEPIPEAEPLPNLQLEKFAEEIALEGSTEPPTESDYIQFANSTLRKAGRALQAQNASKASQTYLLNLLAHPDLLTAIAQSEFPFFQNFAEFLGQSWVNQTPTATLLQHQDDIANAVVQALQEAFPADTIDAEPSPEMLEAETALQGLEAHIVPIKDEEPSIPELPDISEFISDVEDVVPDEQTLLTAQGDMASNETSHPLPDISDFSFLDSTDTETSTSTSDHSTQITERDLTSAFDYAACASNFLRQVILSLPNSASGLEAQAYLQSLLNAPDLLYALASSTQRNLVELATTLETAKLSNTPVDALTAPLSEAVGLVAGDLLQHFRSRSSSTMLEDDDDDMTFTFSELVPPSSFASNTPELDDVMSLSDGESSFETPTQPTPFEASTSEINAITFDKPLDAQPLQEAIDAEQSRVADSDLHANDDASSAFEDSLLLDDSALTLLEEPSTPTLDDLKLDTSQPDADLDFHADDLLLPEDDLLSESPAALAVPSESDSHETTLTETGLSTSLTDSLSEPAQESPSELASAESELTLDTLNLDTLALDTPSLESDLKFDESPLAETPSELAPQELDSPTLQLPVENSSHFTETLDASETLDTISELTFNNELLLDESGMGEMLDAPTSRQDLSQLSSLSDKADRESADDLLFTDTLDDSFLSDSPMLLDDASPKRAISEPPSPLSSSELGESLLEESKDDAPTLELPDLDFSFDAAALDDALPAASELAPHEMQSELASKDLTFSDTLSLDDSSLLAEASPALPAEAQSKSMSSSDFLQHESYESELAPIGDFQLDELQQIFLDEAREYLEKLSADMLELDKFAGTAQPELINRVLRGAHTLKGSAAMVSLNNIRDLGHKMEDCLQVVRDNNLKVPRALLDVCFKSIDAIGVMVENFRRTGEDRFTKSQPLMDLFVAYTKQLQETGTIGDTQVTLTAAPTEQDEVTDFQPDELQQIFLDEANEYLEKLNADMLELEKVAGTAQPELVNRVLRGAHTLKGSAAMVNLKNISELAHKMEDCLQVVRDNNLKVPRPLLDILFKSCDAVGTMLKKFRHTGKDALDVSRYVAILKEYMAQLQQTGEVKTALSLEAAPTTAESQPTPKQKAFTEETVRIDIRSLNNLVNMSAELVISRNRLMNELTGVTRMINKFMKERNQLAQVNKKILTTIQKNAGERADVGAGFSDILKEFSETEFDRFSDLDIISRDVRSAMLNLDETINELRGLSSILGQNVVKVSGIANDLNREIVGMRMVPMRQMYTRFQRSFRDIAKGEGKEIIFNTEGEDTKLDKSVMEEIVEPVLHMVRNAIGHGIEKPEVRLAHGKPAAGTLTLRAYQKGSRIILEIEDDGGGIPVEKVKAKAVRQGLITQEEADAMPASKATELIFLPGFSTADKITELSGRGVGMDVVKNTIRQLKGTVSVETREGKGTKFIISLPVTLAINQALLVSASEHTYAVPLELVLETLSVSSDYLMTDEDGNKTISIRGEEYEFRYLNELLGYSIEPLEYKTMHSVVVIGLDDRKVAVAVEKLIGKEEIVVKSLGRHLRNVRGIIGATILGDGQVVVILDIEYLLRPIGERGEDVQVQALSAPEPETEDNQPTITKRKRKSAKITVLHADDSPSVRKYVQSVLKGANIDVISADDGLNAINRLTQPNTNIDLIVSDLEMPRMNGFEFVTEVRKMDAYKDIPFIIVTARAGDKHRRTGLELGANAFLNKPFDPSQLIETIESYIA